MDTDQKIEFVQRAVVRMARYTKPFIASIVRGESEPANNPHVGTALRLDAGRMCIVTAAHVLDAAAKSASRVAVTAAYGAPPAVLAPTPIAIDRDADLAVLLAPDNYPVGRDDFWSIRRVDVSEQKLSNDYLVVHGFPGVRSTYSSRAKGLFNASLPYGAMKREDRLPANLRSFQFAMDFDEANFRAPDGRPADWLEPHGLSGSPVWRIGASGGRVGEWSPERCSLVGIVTQWWPDEKILVATKIAALTKLVANL